VASGNDGFILCTGGPADYFAPVEEWPAVERDAMDHVIGRVLDVGCGAGRGALELQCQRRGVTRSTISSPPVPSR
jgi:hypothetical protein